MFKNRAGPLPLASLLVVIMLGAVFSIGCASPDQALRDKSVEFTDTNKGIYERDLDPATAKEVVDQDGAEFTKERNAVLGIGVEKKSGEELRGQVLDIVDAQLKRWEARRKKDLPAGFLEIRRDEFASQKTVLRGK